MNNILNECRYNYASYLWNRPYYNNLKILCSPGDKVRIVFYKEVPTIEAELREKLGILEMIMVADIAFLKLINPQPRFSKEQKRLARAIRRSKKKKKRIQAYEGVVLSTKWVKPLDLVGFDFVFDENALLKVIKSLTKAVLWRLPCFEPFVHQLCTKRANIILFLLSNLWIKELGKLLRPAPKRAQVLTVRKTKKGINSEKTFSSRSPWVRSIERIYSSRVRRAKLYYLRGKTGKAARLKRRTNFFVKEVGK